MRSVYSLQGVSILIVLLYNRTKLLLRKVFFLLRWSETKNWKILIIDNSFLLPSDGNKSLCSHRTRKYIAKTEVDTFVTVIGFHGNRLIKFNRKVPEDLISGTFNEGIRMKRFEVSQGIPGINPQVFFALTSGRRHFFAFFHFSVFGL